MNADDPKLATKVKKKIIRKNILTKYVLRKTQKRCWYCGRAATTVDHFFPRKFEDVPRDYLPNLVPACDSCNQAKGNQDAIDFRDPLTYFARKLGLPDPELKDCQKSFFKGRMATVDNPTIILINHPIRGVMKWCLELDLPDGTTICNEETVEEELHNAVDI